MIEGYADPLIDVAIATGFFYSHNALKARVVRDEYGRHTFQECGRAKTIRTDQALTPLPSVKNAAVNRYIEIWRRISRYFRAGFCPVGGESILIKLLQASKMTRSIARLPKLALELPVRFMLCTCCDGPIGAGQATRRSNRMFWCWI